MSSLMNDLAPEEQDPRNQATIAFLRKAYVTDETQVNSARPHGDLQETEQAIVRVRERLLTANQGKPQGHNLRLLSSETTFNSAGHIMGEGPATKKKSPAQEISFGHTGCHACSCFRQFNFPLAPGTYQQDSRIQPGSQHDYAGSKQ